LSPPVITVLVVVQYIIFAALQTKHFGWRWIFRKRGY